MIMKSEVPLFSNSDEKFMQYHRDTFVIIFIKEGNGIISCNNKTYIIRAPSILCLNEDETPSLVENSSLKAVSVSFFPSFVNSSFTINNIRDKVKYDLTTSDMDLFMLKSFIKRDVDTLSHIQLGVESVKQINGYFDRISDELNEQRDKYWICRTRGVFMELLFNIQTQYATVLEEDTLQVMKTSDELIDKVVLHINNYYAEELSIAELSREFAMNRTTLSKRFKEATGFTINNYLVKVRIQLASMMLKETYMPVLEILHNTGFNTPANFNRYFKKQTGLTPSEYRVKYRK